MTYIKRTDGLGATTAGRACLSVSSRIDGGVTVAEVEAVKAGDVELTASQYETELAAIASYNAANPAPPPPPPAFDTSTSAEVAATAVPAGPLSTVKTILAKADADITAGEVKTLVLIMARYFFRKWIAGWR